MLAQTPHLPEVRYSPDTRRSGASATSVLMLPADLSVHDEKKRSDLALSQIHFNTEICRLPQEQACSSEDSHTIRVNCATVILHTCALQKTPKEDVGKKV